MRNRRYGSQLLPLASVLALGLTTAACPSVPASNEVLVVSEPLPPSAMTGAPDGSDVWPAGAVHTSNTFVEFGIYYTPTDLIERGPEFAERLDAALPHVPLAINPTRDQNLPDTTAVLLQPDIADYAPPGPDTPAEWLVGIDGQGFDRLARSSHVLVAALWTDQPDNRADQASLCNAVASMARELDGYVWDELTQETFTPTAFVARRCPDGMLSPLIDHHVTFHYYQEDDGYRLVTLGMQKFGLPDLLVNDVSPVAAPMLAQTLYLLAQRFAEGATVGAGGRIPLSIGAVEDPSLRAQYREFMWDDASGNADIYVGVATPRVGDPNNELMEVLFPTDRQHRYQAQTYVVSELFGNGSDPIVDTNAGDPELIAASERARAELFDMLDRGLDTLPFGSTLSVKLPFDVPNGGVEFMWVTVVSADSDTLSGILASDPAYIPGLEPGALIEAPIDQAFDFYLYLPDGTQQGGYTNEVLERR